MFSLESERTLFAPLRQKIHAGDMQGGRAWLAQCSLSQKVLYPLFVAICAEEEQLLLWERAIQKLEEQEPCTELLFALEKAAHQCRLGNDSVRLRAYLARVQEVSKKVSSRRELLQYQAIYANRIFLDGYPEKAQELLRSVITQAQQEGETLLVISQSVLLSGILMSQQKWVDAAALSLIMENAAILRHNPIALACARMTRASAWYAQDKVRPALRLLLTTGREFHSQGAVAALNLVKARLAELRALLGPEEFNRLCADL